MFPKIGLCGKGIIGGGTCVAASWDFSRHVIHQGKLIERIQIANEGASWALSQLEMRGRADVNDICPDP
jgi:hypothetical protein